MRIPIVNQEVEVEKVAWFSKEELKDWYSKNPEEFVGLMKELVKHLA